MHKAQYLHTFGKRLDQSFFWYLHTTASLQILHGIFSESYEASADNFKHISLIMFREANVFHL